MNKFVCIKSHIGGKFSKISLGQLYVGGTVVVHLYCGFLCGIRWRHSRAPNSEPDFWSILYQFEERVLPVMHGFGRGFHHLLEMH